MSTRDSPNYGQGVQAVDTDDPDARVSAEDLAAQIRRVLDATDYQPPSLPQVAMKLMALARQPQIEFQAVAGVLEQDPMLAAKVLARAQSALYMATSPVRTLRDAVVRLGLRTVRDLVLEVALNLRVFNAPLYSGIMERVRRHSVATAYAARLICRYTSIDAEYAFLCGLLHDMGIAASLIVLGGRRARVPADLLWPALDETHEASSSLVARLWTLPEEVTLVVGSHHHPRLGGFSHPLVSALQVAEFLVGELDLGMAEPNADWLIDAVSARELDAGAAVLRLGETQLGAIRTQLAEMRSDILAE